MHSWNSTVFIDSSYEVGYCSPIWSKSNLCGQFYSKYLAISMILSSLLIPPDPAVLG